MTVEDWHRLASICMDMGGRYAGPDHALANEYYALASKFAEREAALRQGRVMP
jgi:hypothetical protein